MLQHWTCGESDVTISSESVKILVVDDEWYISELLSRWLTTEGYYSATAANAEEAWALLENEKFTLMISDINMPGKSGIDLLSMTRQHFPDVAVIMATALDDRKTAIRTLELGAYDYLIKPYDQNELLISIANALERRRLFLESQEYERRLKEEVRSRTRDLTHEVKERKRAEERLQESLGKLRTVMEGTIQAMALVTEMRDPYTAGHQRRVAALSSAIAKEMGLSEEEIDGIHLAGIVHDIGKIYVPAEILSKPGRLTEIEFHLIKVHPQVGYDILKTIEFPWPIAKIVLQHHEKMNGSGYPDGLSGEDILLGARILSVADVVEAISSHRPYRPALGIEKALSEVVNNRGTFFDSRVVDACTKLFTKGKFQFG
ncbi:MAG: HD domain-containing phosphohydrolase [Syntrophobacteraceae bacterium]